jgi:hypothetical protein
MINVTLGIGNFFGDLGHFKGLLVKSCFSNFVHVSWDSIATCCTSLSFSLCHRIDPTEL